MNFYKLYGMSFILGLSMISGAYAGPDDPATPVPDLKLGATQPRSEFYAKVNSGAVFFRPPEKDNGNFADAVNLPAPPGQADGATSLGSQTGNATAASFGGTFGMVLDAQPTEAWMGRNFRAEVSGGYFQTVNTQNAGVSVNPGGVFTTVGRLDGNYTGTNQSTDIGSTTAGPNPIANETLTTRDKFYHVGAAVRSDYIFDQGQLVLSPILGFEYSHLSQNFYTTAAGNRGSINQQETIDTIISAPSSASNARSSSRRLLSTTRKVICPRSMRPPIIRDRKSAARPALAEAPGQTPRTIPRIPLPSRPASPPDSITISARSS